MVDPQTPGGFPASHRRRRWGQAGAAALVGLGTLGCGGMLFAQPRQIRPSQPVTTEATAGPGLWVTATPLDDGRQLLLVIDPHLKNAAVYHVDAQTGAMTLKSARNITYDLMVQDYNCQEPRPAALRKMLEVGGETATPGQIRP